MGVPVGHDRSRQGIASAASNLFGGAEFAAQGQIEGHDREVQGGYRDPLHPRGNRPGGSLGFLGPALVEDRLGVEQHDGVVTSPDGRQIGGDRWASLYSTFWFCHPTPDRLFAELLEQLGEGPELAWRAAGDECLEHQDLPGA